jgi:molybdate transport system substrate-binding protein
LTSESSLVTSATFKLVSSMATRDVLAELASQYQRLSGHTVVTEAGGGVDVAKRVRAGEIVDIVVLASDVVDQLIAEGKLRGKRVDVVKSGIAVAIRAGAGRPDISSEAAVKRAVSNAKSLSYSTGPSGTYLEKMFAHWGILEAIRSRIVVPPPGIPVASLVADGKAELGFQQASELLNRPGIDVLGPLPDEIQSLTIFAGGVSSTCSNPAGAGAALEYMASPAATAIKKKYGMDAA